MRRCVVSRMLRSAEGQYRRQALVSARTASIARKLWGRLGDDFSAEWAGMRPLMVDVVESGRAAAVVTALPYTAAALLEQNTPAPAVAQLNPARFMASAPSGAAVVDVLEAPVIRTKTLIGQGMPAALALEQAGSYLAGIVLTMLADTRRSVYGADIISRPRVGGYVRMLQAPSCSRCVILAGKFFRWNAGFQRHPRCDCQHLPATGRASAESQGLISDPYEYFNSLSKEQQEKVFGKSESRAIRDGADIFRVENVRLRGLGTANGRGMTRWYSTMTVDDIYRTAGTRTNALRMLEQQGYTRGPQVLRQAPERFSAPISRPVVAGSNRDRVLTARRTGVRDPLDTATMTAQERRLYDAWYKLNFAETRGAIARSTTGRLSSSDVFALERAATPADVSRLRQELEDEFARQFGSSTPPASVVELAGLLGLI
mgnify:FL=1